MDETLLIALLAKMNTSYADVSGVTATAEDVAQGKFFVDSNKVLTEGTASGGGGFEGMYTLTLDVDGTSAGAVSIEQGKAVTSNPLTPSKTNYRFLGWSLTSGGTLITFPYTPTADGTLYAVFEEGVRCTVSNLGASSPSTVSFTKDAGFTVAGLGIEEVTFNTDTFIKIPTMYRKVNTVVDNQITSFTIANAKIDNDYKPYSCFVGEDGSLLPYILIGKYWNTEANGCVSTTEAQSTTVGQAIGRSNAQNRGTGYQIYDWQMHKLWQDLIICLKGTVNTNTGAAWTYDELGIYWTISPCWIDGVMGSGGTWKLCTKPSKYASLSATSDPIPSDYVSAGYAQPTTSEREVQKLGYDSSNPFFSFPRTITSNDSYNTYYCDGYHYGSGNRPVRTNVGYTLSYYGAFYYDANCNWFNGYGVRLCYRPIAS